MSEPSSKQPGRVVAWLLDRATREAEVHHVEVLAPNLRLVTFVGESLRGVEWTPGDMVQVILSGSTLLGPWEMRSYTPLLVDCEQGTMQILAVVHGSAPGSDWFASAQLGKRCRFVGPRYALSLVKPRRPLVFFGDETSFGTAVALRAAQRGSGGLHFIFEVGSVEESRAILMRFGIAEAVRFIARRRTIGTSIRSSVRWLNCICPPPRAVGFSPARLHRSSASTRLCVRLACRDGS